MFTTARLLKLATALAVLLAAAPAVASARVSATVSGRVLVVDGTSLHDEIVVSLSGSNLRVDDKDRVNANTGCSRSGDVALCPRSLIDKVRIDGQGSGDSIQVNGNVPVPSDVSGGDGDDTLSVFSGADGNRLAGGADNDTLHDGQADDVLEGGPGNDTLEGAVGKDRLRGDAGQDVLRGGFGDDDLEGGAGSDSLFGDDGDDTVTYSGSAGVTVQLGSTGGNGGVADAPGDVVNATVENVTGGTGPDTLTGSDGANVLTGGQGNDTLDGAGGDDVLEPGGGVDVVHGGGGRDTISWDPFAGPTMTVLGLPGASGRLVDIQAGGGTIDADVEDVQGGSGDDVVIGTPGANTFRGGTGFDTMSYAGRQFAVIADADGVADDGAAGEGDNIGIDVEGIEGGDLGDQLTATDSSDGLLAVGAAVGQTTVKARLIGGPGSDALIGSNVGGDNLIGGPAIDRLDGRGGPDVLEAQGDGVADIVNCGEGPDFAKVDLVDGFGTFCETVQVAAVGRHPTVAFAAGRAVLAGGVLRVGLSCPRSAARACRGTLDAAGAKASFAVPRGAKRTVRVRLGAAAAKRLRKAGRVRLTATEKDPEGRPKTSRTVLRVRSR